MSTCTGTNFADVMYCSNTSDTIRGLAGNDVIFAGRRTSPWLDTGNDRIYGDAGNDTLYAYGGNDYLYGGIGADTMYGGTGSDVYFVDNSGDRVIESANAGTDRVYSSISYTLTANVENLSLTGSAYYGYGNSLNNQILGTYRNNYLWGADGNDQLQGYSGRDTLSGGNGNDNLYGGNDNDALYGSNGLDYLNGGTGADFMFGGADNDRYVVDNVGDRVLEYTGQGIDHVSSSINYTLGSNVEHLRLTGTAINGTGNALSNGITGNSENNILRGEEGNDTLSGERGSDTLLGGDGRDTLVGGGTSRGEYDILTGGAGTDTFVLDNGWGSAYEGAGYATITDFTCREHVLSLGEPIIDPFGSLGTIPIGTIGTREVTIVIPEKIQVVGSLSDYRLVKNINFSGGSALDTLIYKGHDLIGVVQDTTKPELNSSFFATVPETVLI